MSFISFSLLNMLITFILKFLLIQNFELSLYLLLWSVFSLSYSFLCHVVLSFVTSGIIECHIIFIKFFNTFVVLLVLSCLPFCQLLCVKVFIRTQYTIEIDHSGVNRWNALLNFRKISPTVYQYPWPIVQVNAHFALLVFSFLQRYSKQLIAFIQSGTVLNPDWVLTMVSLEQPTVCSWPFRIFNLDLVCCLAPFLQQAKTTKCTLIWGRQ